MAKILLPSSLSDRAIARRVANDAVGYGQFTRRHVPLLGRRLQQHHARRRAATADIILRGTDAAAAAGAHFAPGALAGEIARRRDAFGRHLIPVALEFFRDQLCQPGDRSLAHFRARDADHAGIVGLDRDPDVDFGRRRLRLCRRDAERDIQSQREAAARDSGRADDKIAACEFGELSNVLHD
jgi:hypothetical protein